jgi:hypothetical protein
MFFDLSVVSLSLEPAVVRAIAEHFNKHGIGDGDLLKITPVQAASGESVDRYELTVKTSPDRARALTGR